MHQKTGKTIGTLIFLLYYNFKKLLLKINCKTVIFQNEARLEMFIEDTPSEYKALQEEKDRVTKKVCRYRPLVCIRSCFCATRCPFMTIIVIIMYLYIHLIMFI